MVRAALAEESLLPKEKRCRWASYVVDCAVVRCAPPLAGGVSCSYAVVRVTAGDDGAVDDVRHPPVPLLLRQQRLLSKGSTHHLIYVG